ncbi:MAG: hypothetical protein E7258_09735 [Lachnospiraceae bacterium]|nr:hypothetical protein [Lachnospiraceae bacterium]
MKKKIILALICCTMLGLSGCGKEKETTTEVTTEATTEATTTETTEEITTEEVVTTTEEETTDPTKVPYTEAYKTVYLGEQVMENVELFDYSLSVESGAETGTVYAHIFITEVYDYNNVEDYFDIMSTYVSNVDSEDYYGENYEYGQPKSYYNYSYDYNYMKDGVECLAVVNFFYTVEDLDETKLMCTDRDGNVKLTVNSTLEELTCINPEISEHKAILKIKDELYFAQLDGTPTGMLDDGSYFAVKEVTMVCCLSRPFATRLDITTFTIDDIENVDFLLCQYDDSGYDCTYLEPTFTDETKKYVAVDGNQIRFGFTGSEESFWRKDGFLEADVPVITIDGKTTTIYETFLLLD